MKVDYERPPKSSTPADCGANEIRTPDLFFANPAYLRFTTTHKMTFSPQVRGNGLIRTHVGSREVHAGRPPKCHPECYFGAASQNSHASAEFAHRNLCEQF